MATQAPRISSIHDAKRSGLRLVAQTLLVAVRLRALASLVLIDLGFSSLLEGTHKMAF